MLSLLEGDVYFDDKTASTHGVRLKPILEGRVWTIVAVSGKELEPIDHTSSGEGLGIFFRA